MYKEDLALDNLQWLICHKTKPNQIIYMYKDDLALNNCCGPVKHTNSGLCETSILNESINTA